MEPFDQAKADSLAATLDAFNEKLTCERCGKTGDDVAVDFDPYQKQIEDIEIEITTCVDCYDEIAGYI